LADRVDYGPPLIAELLNLMVFTLVRERSIPVVMVLSGGYSTLSWQIHADAIEGILTRFDK
jgi:hypothetical protein